MPSGAPTYDLVLLLDPQAEESARTKILADARSAIERQGELLRDDSWGERQLAYPIAHKTNALYHLFQFHIGATQLLDDLDRSLRITDEVLRFRLVKLKPGVPDAPDMRPSGAPAPAPRTESQPPEGQSGDAGDVQAGATEPPETPAQDAQQAPAPQPA